MSFEKSQVYGDLESDSTSSEHIDFLRTEPAERPRRRYLNWSWLSLRLGIEACMAVAILFLAVSRSVNQSPKPHKYGPTLPRKDVILGNTAHLGPDIEYNNHEMLWNKTEMQRIHRNWQQLFPKGRGYIEVHDHDDFTVMHPPFHMDDVLVPGDHYDGYIMAVYHQLHCLSILTTSLGTSREEWKEMNPRIREHRSHCVEYLRQSILCNADTTIEGETGAWTKSTGWGQTHSCVDFDVLTKFANKRAIWDLSDQLLPEHFDFTKADVEGKPRSKVDESKYEGDEPHADHNER